MDFLHCLCSHNFHSDAAVNSGTEKSSAVSSSGTISYSPSYLRMQNLPCISLQLLSPTPEAFTAPESPCAGNVSSEIKMMLSLHRGHWPGRCTCTGQHPHCSSAVLSTSIPWKLQGPQQLETTRFSYTHCTNPSV